MNKCKHSKKMATHFSANQYENAFAANRLQNYEVPNNFKERPTARKGCTKVISNNRGHLLSDVPRSKESPWGNFKGTWDDELDFRKNPKHQTNKHNNKSVEHQNTSNNVSFCVQGEDAKEKMMCE